MEFHNPKRAISCHKEVKIFESTCKSEFVEIKDAKICSK